MASPHSRDFVEFEAHSHTSSSSRSYTPPPRINHEDNEQVDNMRIPTLAKRIVFLLNKYQEEQPEQQPVQNPEQNPQQQLEQQLNEQKLQVERNIRHVIVECNRELQKLKQGFTDEIAFFSEKSKKRKSYADSCLTVAVKLVGILNDPKTKPHLKRKGSIKAMIFFSKTILNAPVDQPAADPAQEEQVPLLWNAYSQRANYFSEARKWYHCFYDCGILMSMSTCTQEIRQKYIDSCIGIAKIRLKKFNQDPKTEDPKRRSRYIQIALRYLELAEMENVALENDTDLKRQIKTKYITEIKRLRSKCCVYQPGTMELSNDQLVTSDYDISEPSLRPFVWSNLSDNAEFSVKYSLTAKKAFKKGETVFFERPFVALPAYVLHYCGMCYKQVDFQFVPCIYCNEVVYCDFSCRQMATFHLQTCGYEYRVASLLSAECHLVYQLLARQEKDSVNNVVEKVATHPFIDNKIENFPGLQLSAMLTGRAKMTKFATQQMENLVVVQAIQVALILANKCTNFSQFNDEANLVKLSKCVYFLLLSHYVSPYTGKSLQVANGDTSRVNNIHGHGMFGYRLKHWCQPNIIRRYNLTGSIVYKALKNIPENSVLTINYGVNNKLPVLSRINYLHKYFNFTICNCPECKKELNAKTNPPIDQLINKINNLGATKAKLETRQLLERQCIVNSQCGSYEMAEQLLENSKNDLRDLNHQLQDLLRMNSDTTKIENDIKAEKKRLKITIKIFKSYQTVHSIENKLNSINRKIDTLLKQKNAIDEIIQGQRVILQNDGGENGNPPPPPPHPQPEGENGNPPPPPPHPQPEGENGNPPPPPPHPQPEGENGNPPPHPQPEGENGNPPPPPPHPQPEGENGNPPPHPPPEGENGNPPPVGHNSPPRNPNLFETPPPSGRK